jgi:hypothetical protein
MTVMDSVTANFMRFPVNWKARCYVAIHGVMGDVTLGIEYCGGRQGDLDI